MRPVIITAAWLILAAIFIFTDGPIYLRPETGFPNVERFVGLCALGFAFSLAYPGRRLLTLKLLLIAVCSFEYLQQFVLYRHGTFHDAGLKSAGLAVGFVLGRLYDEIRASRSIKAAGITD